jgi:hypothetical protein
MSDGSISFAFSPEVRCFNMNTQTFSELKMLGTHYQICKTGGVFPIHCEKTLVRGWRGSCYKYYNCKTGQFDKTVLERPKGRGSPAYDRQRLVYDHQEDSSYQFLYAYVVNYAKDQYTTSFKKVSQKEDRSVTILPGSIITIKGKNFEIIDGDKSKIIVYTRTDKGFRIPHLLDLNSPKPVVKDILTRQEVCDLKSDVCKVKIKNNKIFWYTNFEKMDKKESDVTFLAKEITPLTKFNNIFIKQERELRHKFLTHPCIKTTDELFTKKIKQFTQAGTTQGHHLKKYGTENFLNFYKKSIEAHMWDAAKKVIGHIKYETIDIPGTSFKMPVSTIMASPHTSRFVLHYHGGPHSRNDNQIRYDHVFFTQCGYNFTEHNFRGSSGFGPKYMLDLYGKWFSHTRDDTALVLNHMRKNGLKEGDFPIAFGCSFGGYAAVNAFVNGQCTRAIAINGLYDLNLECQIRPLLAFEFGRLKKSREKNSLLNKIKPRKGAAMLIIAGSQDTICSPKHSEKLFEKMKKEGNSVEYFNIQGMGHSATTQEHAHLIYSIIAAWLGKLDGDQKCEKVFNTLKTHHTVVYKGHTGHPPSDSLAKDAPTPQAVLSQGF